jgi:hypothetical protein
MVLMVFLQQEVDVLVNQPLHFPHEMGSHATIPGECHGIKPELALSVGTPNVNMGRLYTLIRVEVEAKTTDS